MAVHRTRNSSVQVAQRALRHLSVSAHHFNVHPPSRIREPRALEQTSRWVLQIGDRRTRTKSCGCSTRQPSHSNFFAAILIF
jgi:hypothetical protein